MLLKFNDAEFATLLAALRFYQAGLESGRVSAEIQTIADNDEEIDEDEVLDTDEIETLCQTLNTGGRDIPEGDFTVAIPETDCDVVLSFPSGKAITIQCRPSNADTGYNGSLDIILPDNQAVTNWKGDDMEDAPSFDGSEHVRTAKQLCIELP